MISIEAHRAAIGRFSRKAMSFSLISSAMKKTECPDILLFMYLVTLWLMTLYTLVLTAMYEYYHYIIFFVMVASMYSYSLWIVKRTCDIFCATVEKMARRNDLMRASIPSKGIKVFPLIPCNYLDTYVFDGRCKNLDTSVLDDGCCSIKIDCPKFMISVTNGVQICLSYTCSIIIFSSCIYIAFDILSRINDAYIGLHDLESYSVSFLKLSQLLLAGDVESNPGPGTNNSETPKGRGRPKKGTKTCTNLKNFNTKRKLDFTNVDANISVYNISNKIKVLAQYKVP